MNYKVLFYCILSIILISCNSDDDDKDMEKPSIDMTAESAFPTNCVVLLRGESFSFNARFADNVELGNYNLEIHNNFDHHSHSTENEECELDPKKQPVKPWIYNKDYPIPAGQISFTANDVIEIPANIDTGDYHFMIRLTDKAGWQQIKSVEVKIK